MAILITSFLAITFPVQTMVFVRAHSSSLRAIIAKMFSSRLAQSARVSRASRGSSKRTPVS
ncbi:hypothetical protein TYRP_014670 [Tyrophagus putrescentiae]|nr:hypothetical protein TYRP_014670 [Tyrophagus putrescentiae]